MVDTKISINSSVTSSQQIKFLVGEKKWAGWKKDSEKWDYCENCYEEVENSDLKHFAQARIGFSRDAWANTLNLTELTTFAENA